MFPRGAFAPSDRFGGAEALQARDDPVARRLLDQLSKGVFAAVKARYARTITYSVVAPNDDDDDGDDGDDDDERVLEEYAFTIRYGEETGAAASGDASALDAVSVDTVSVRAGGRTVSATDAPAKRQKAWNASHHPLPSSLDDEEKIKDAGDQMLRQLEALIEHLDPAPSGSKIGIRLTYVDSTPPEYEPPFFESVEPSRTGDGTFESTAERRDCGGVETRFHALSLRWTGLAGAERRDAARADGERARRTRVAEKDAEKAPEKALFPFPFESQPEPEPEPESEPRDYHYLSQSEPQLDSESPGLDAARGPAGRSPPRIGWADGFANGRANGSVAAADPASALPAPPGLGPAFSLTGSIPLSRSPSSPFKPVGGGSRGKAGRRAGDSAASFSFGGGGSQASLGANASLGFGGFGGFGGGGFGSPIRRGSVVAAGGAAGKRAGEFPTPPSTPWRKRLRSADAVAI